MKQNSLIALGLGAVGVAVAGTAAYLYFNQSPSVCNEGVTRCSNNVNQKCISNAWVADPYGTTCINCTEGTYRCSGGINQKCLYNQWVLDPTGTVCPCTEGSVRCSAGVNQKCVSGVWVIDPAGNTCAIPSIKSVTFPIYYSYVQNPAAGVRVTLKDGLSVVQSVITGADGLAKFTNLQPKNYTLWCEKAGWHMEEYNNPAGKKEDSVNCDMLGVPFGMDWPGSAVFMFPIVPYDFQAVWKPSDTSDIINGTDQLGDTVEMWAHRTNSACKEDGNWPSCGSQHSIELQVLAFDQWGDPIRSVNNSGVTVQEGVAATIKKLCFSVPRTSYSGCLNGCDQSYYDCGSQTRQGGYPLYPLVDSRWSDYQTGGALKCVVWGCGNAGTEWVAQVEVRGVWQDPLTLADMATQPLVMYLHYHQAKGAFGIGHVRTCYADDLKFDNRLCPG